MKITACFLMLAISIAGNLCAQENAPQTNADKTFEPAPNIILRKFIIELDKGNKVQIELSEMEDLHHFSNMDSLLRVFLQDMLPFKDSLSDELATKRIDYVFDATGKKKVRIRQYKSKDASFLINQSDIAALKLEQDTVNFMGTVPAQEKYIFAAKATDPHYYRLSFFINNINELASYMDGRLSEKILELEKNNYTRWIKHKDGEWYLKKDPTIIAKQPAGFSNGAGDFLEINFGINMQNYKNYFMSSFHITAGIGSKTAHFKNEFDLSWEPGYLFAKNSLGNLQTYRNDFVSLTFNHEPLKKNPNQGFYLPQSISLGYLINRQGDFLDPHTFRLGIDRFSLLNGKVKLEPLIYFHNFFKGVTPGVRVTIGF